MTQVQNAAERPAQTDRLPLAGLLALAAAGFITIMTEALPAGILPAMGSDLGVTGSAIGQTVTIYAIGSLLAAVPLTAATIGWQRRRVLLLAITGFAVANSVTAVSDNYVATMVARFAAGVAAGLLWGLLAGYARRMVAPQHRGRAMAIAMAGTPVALSIGVPAGTLVAGLVGWRVTFGIMTLLTLVLMGWVIAAVPNLPGQQKRMRVPLYKVIGLPGIIPVLVVTILFVVSHNILYTYIASFLAPLGLGDQVGSVLLIFGGASLFGTWVTGVWIDRRLRLLVVSSCALFALAVLGLAVFAESLVAVFVSSALWGLSFGGAPSLLQTAAADAAAEALDVAQSLVVTSWNIGIAGGGIIGGLLLSGVGPTTLPWATLALLLPALLIAIFARRHAFRS